MLTPDMEKDWMESRGMKVHEWTEQEKNWIEERQKPNYPAACVRIHKDKWGLDQEECKHCPYNERPVCFCPLSPDYKDAAEYEARVAKKLSEKVPFVMHMASIKDNTYMMHAETALMLARLDVEQEMEAE